jgi:ferric-dicitrate binding protein FerR (iron transport regulator)
MKNKDIEDLILSWFEGTISPEETARVEQWKNASEENRQVFADSQKPGKGLSICET